MNGKDHEHLQAFRRVARKVRTRSVIEKEEVVRFRTRARETAEGYLRSSQTDQTPELLEEEAFRALAMDVRLVGPFVLYLVQGVILKIAGRILDLDDVIADFLGEDRLPRFTDESTGVAASA